jgi:hypothetical protein
MNREEKIKFLQALEEKKKRKASIGTAFKPNTLQSDVLKCSKPEVYLFCANGVGKSALLTNKLHWSANGYNPLTKQFSQVPTDIVLVLPTPEKIDDIIKEYRKWNRLEDEQLHKDGKAKVSRITWPNGSRCIVMTHEVSDFKAEGIEMDVLLFDEPPPRRLYVALTRGGRKKGRKLEVLMAGTPLSAAWLKSDIYVPWQEGKLPNVEIFRANTDVNKENLAEGYIESFSSRLTDRERKMRLEGEFGDEEALPLANLFNKDTQVQDVQKLITKDWVFALGVDPHTSKPHTAVLIGVDEKNQMYVVKELAAKVPPREFAKSLRKMCEGLYVVDVLCDSAGQAEMTGGEGYKSFIQICQEEGLRIRPTSFRDKSDEEFILRLQDSIPHVIIDTKCVGVLYDIFNTKWNISRDGVTKPKLDIRERDYLAAFKYALSCGLVNKKKNMQPFYIKKPMYGINLQPNLNLKINRWNKN